MAAFGAIAACVALGCDRTGPSVADLAIGAFIAAQHLDQAQPPSTVLSIPSGRLVFFRVEFGPLVGCDWTRCRAYGAVGLLVENRIGWLEYSGPDSTSLRDALLDLRPSDAYLFSTAFADSVCAHDWSLCHYVVPKLLARDPDTPRWRLLVLAQGLAAFIWPWLAEALIDHPVAGNDREILTIIATLPVFQGDAYQDVRARARQRLGLP